MFSDFEQKQFGNGEDNTRRYFECDLLIIDDLGTELTNQFTVSCFYNVLNSRTNYAKSTFINTNLSKKEIEAKYSQRITSRLFGEFLPIVFSGSDIRLQKVRE
jgi:DNA replication protein DnaC